MKLFSVAIRVEKNKQWRVAAGFTTARNEDEAVGLGMKLATDSYKEDDGFHSHSVAICEIPSKVRDQRMESTDAQEILSKARNAYEKL